MGDRISINTNQQSVVKPRDLRSNDRVMVGLKKAFETRYSDGSFLTKRGETAPGGKDVKKVIDAANFAKMIMAWHCQRPNIAYNEKKLFDEYYKTIFRTGYPPESALALLNWMSAIDAAWPNLNLNDELRAARAYARYHVLYAVSSLIGSANKQQQNVVAPSATMKTFEYASEILNMAATCVENAMQSANVQAQTSSKLFSPQNWLKNNASWQGENLVASTQVGMLGSLPMGPALLEKMRVPAGEFQPRWSAD